jgi:hypothetical protein
MTWSLIKQRYFFAAWSLVKQEKRVHGVVLRDNSVFTVSFITDYEIKCFITRVELVVSFILWTDKFSSICHEVRNFDWKLSRLETADPHVG